MEKQRIAYIDAMRGFTMILVVYSHVCWLSLGDVEMGGNRVLLLFRLPCFFFISGWLFAPVARRPFWPTVRHKFMVQIVPTTVFLLLLAPPPAFFHQLGTFKGGYWFTFVLFEFFALYMLSVRCCRRWSWVMALLIAVLAYALTIYQNELRSMAVCGWQDAALDAVGLMSLPLWRYYLFFFFGAVVRQRFTAFVSATDRYWVLSVSVTGFVACALLPSEGAAFVGLVRFAVGGLMGVVLVFTVFRRLNISWRPLQFVGTRTLDIYMLHYFFLPNFLQSWASHLQAADSLLCESGVAMAVAIAVVAVCLAVSYVIRLSPFLGHYLFGAKWPGK